MHTHKLTAAYPGIEPAPWTSAISNPLCHVLQSQLSAGVLSSWAGRCQVHLCQGSHYSLQATGNRGCNTNWV